MRMLRIVFLSFAFTTLACGGGQQSAEPEASATESRQPAEPGGPAQGAADDYAAAFAVPEGDRRVMEEHIGTIPADGVVDAVVGTLP